MERYPEELTLGEYLSSDCYKVASFALAQSLAMGALRQMSPVAPTLWEIVEEAKVLGCLPVITLVPRDAALAVMGPVLEAADFPKPPPS
ncbi:hypothetical protein [Parvibacter caecicola]|uniref:hypothetical protein n=1 Tax=Parvibacter caecicola TaxID=747645 RepID=UPI00272F796F|nr:hypothetical protein [Parvibacter caecicola]